MSAYPPPEVWRQQGLVEDGDGCLGGNSDVEFGEEQLTV